MHELSLIQELLENPVTLPYAFKLLDTILKGCGALTAPLMKILHAKADSYVAMTHAETQATIALMAEDVRDEIERRTLDRAESSWERMKRFKEERRQANIEAIAYQALQMTADSVSKDPVDQDWATEFINFSQDVSDEEMRSLWARILAGEVAKPGSFSMRTLSLVKTLGKDDADKFTRFCSMVWEQRQAGVYTPTAIVFNYDMIASIDGIELTLNDLIELDSMGLIRFEGQAQTTSRYSEKSPEPGEEPSNSISVYWRYQGRDMTFWKPKSPKTSFEISQNAGPNMHLFPTGKIMLTKIGRELYPIARPRENPKYLEWTIRELTHHGWRLEGQ